MGSDEPVLVFMESVAETEVSTVDLMEIVASPLAGDGDRVQGSTIRDVKILGFNSQNPTLGFPTRYTAEAMAKALPLYEGAPVHIGHPPREQPFMERPYSERIGRVKNVRLAKDGLRGNLVLNPEHPITKPLLHDAKHEPDLVGLSHVARADGKVVDGEYRVHDVRQVVGVDVVTRPSTTRGLFESVNTTSRCACGRKAEDDMGADAKKAMEAQGATVKTETVAAPEKKADVTLMESRLAAAEERAKKAEDRLAAVEGELGTAKKREKVQALAKDAKLPAHLMTPLFESVLMEAKDDAAIKAHLEERIRFGASVTTQHVESRAQGAPPANPTAPKVTDGKSFAKALGL